VVAIARNCPANPLAALRECVQEITSSRVPFHLPGAWWFYRLRPLPQVTPAEPPSRSLRSPPSPSAPSFYTLVVFDHARQRGARGGQRDRGRAGLGGCRRQLARLSAAAEPKGIRGWRRCHAGAYSVKPVRTSRAHLDGRQLLPGGW